MFFISSSELTNTVKTGATVHDAIFRFRSNDKDLGEFPVAQFSFPGRETVDIELNGVVLKYDRFSVSVYRKSSLWYIV